MDWNVLLKKTNKSKSVLLSMEFATNAMIRGSFRTKSAQVIVNINLGKICLLYLPRERIHFENIFLHASIFSTKGSVFMIH